MSDFIGWVQIRNTKDNYGRLIDFLSQISKLSNFNMLDLAYFMMHTCSCNICASFRAVAPNLFHLAIPFENMT